jgi:hypothetical protein
MANRTKKYIMNLLKLWNIILFRSYSSLEPWILCTSTIQMIVSHIYVHYVWTQQHLTLLAFSLLVFSPCKYPIRRLVSFYGTHYWHRTSSPWGNREQKYSCHASQRSRDVSNKKSNDCSTYLLYHRCIYVGNWRRSAIPPCTDSYCMICTLDPLHRLGEETTGTLT